MGVAQALTQAGLPAVVAMQAPLPDPTAPVFMRELYAELATGQAFRVEVKKVSSGDVKLPSGLVRVEEGDDDDEGIWETAGYADAPHQVLLIIEKLSSGSVDIDFGGI